RAVRTNQIPGIERGATSMSATAILMQVSSAEPLPEDAPAEAVALAADAANQAATAPVIGGELDLLHLVLHASLPVQLGMLLLLFASSASWVSIFRKTRMLDRAEKEADRFEERLWSGADLGKLYAAASERNRDVEGLESIFEAGFREYTRSGQRRGADSRAKLEGAQRGMRVASSRELDGLE